MKKIAVMLGILIVVIAMAYVFFRAVGVTVATTPNAFSVPAMEKSTFQEDLHKPTIHLDITPAPWPTEAAWIYRVASLGIPVNIRLQGKNKLIEFTIASVDQQGHLVIYPKDIAHFNAISAAFH